MHFHIFTTIRGLSIALFLILFSISLNAQSGVKIKERVSISPTQKSLLSTASGGGFDIDFQYSGTFQEGTSVWKDIIINDQEPCSTRHTDSAPLVTGFYQTMIDFFAKTTGIATCRYYVNGQELLSKTYEVNSVINRSRIFNDFYFSESFRLYPDSVFVKPGYWEDASPLSVGANCQTNVGWTDYYPMTWSIVQGAEWGSFYNYNDDSLGTTFTACPHLCSFGFRLATNIPDSISCVIIKAESNGIEKYKKIYPWKELDHFKVTIVPDTASVEDTVAFTEGAMLKIQAKDINDKDIIIDANTVLKLSLLTNTDYGTFIDAKGDTLKTTPVQLSNIFYSDANAGKIKFAAVKKNPVSLVACKIHVEKQGYPEKFGERDAIVVEQTLKIVMNGDYVVEPRNLTARSNIPNPTNENKKRFIVQLTRNRVGVTNHPFRLTTDYVDGTGGHDHITERRTESRINYGYFIQIRNGSDGRPFNGQTQSDGKEVFDYVSSIFGDSMKIYLKSNNPKKERFLKDSVTIAEKVELINFGLITSDIWDLSGNTGTTSVSACPGTEIHHSSNHYITANTSRRVQDAIRTFAEWSGSERGGGHSLVLGINDMSLMNGGLFDICSNWLPPHQSHRRGTGVDVDGTARRFDGQGFVNLHTELAPDGRTFLYHLTDIMGDYNATRANELSIHYNF